MKLTFVGTSHGVPEKERYCSCTMIESGGARYFIDAGAPLGELVKRCDWDIREIRAVFTTHVHADHTVGIPHFADLINWFYKEAAVDFYITEQPLIDAIKGLILAMEPGSTLKEDRVRFHLTDPTVDWEDENLKLHYIPTKHLPEGHPSYAILVTEKASGSRVLFSGDLSIRLEKSDVPTILAEEELDAFVCEMAHFSAEALKPYLDACRAKNLFFTHVAPAKKFEDIEALKPGYRFEIHTPADGDSVEF